MPLFYSSLKESDKNFTDEELVKKTLENQEFFVSLMKRYEQKLFHYILKISSFSKEEAEDLLQEIFLKVYQNLNDFDVSLKFSSWIYRITHNEVISQYRKRKRRPEGNIKELEDFVWDNLASSLDISKEISRQEQQKTIRRVLRRMDKKYREVLVLKFLEEKDYKEISDILQKPLGTVATLLNRAKKEFKKLSQQAFFEL